MTTPRPLENSVPPLSPDNYAQFHSLLLERCGLHFTDNRRSELELAIRYAFAASTCTTLDEYYRLLAGPNPNAVELDRLINAVTVNETHFFRDEAQFNALYTYVLPQIIERQRPVRSLRIWSAGCASGEEPYSIAMLLRELLPDIEEWAITILGTDINTEALNRARRATYGEWAFRENRARHWRPRFFHHTYDNHYELIPAVRQMVTFARLNLAEHTYPALETNTTALNLILCRNVTIYFSPEVTSQVVDRFYDALVEEGWLVVGASEYSLTTYLRFQSRQRLEAVLYQRNGQLPPTPVERPRPADRVKNIIRTPEPSAPTVQPIPAILPQTSPQAIHCAIPAALPPVIDRLEQARELIEYGHTEQARDILLEFVRQFPNQAQAYALLGQACANLGAWAEAEQWCQRAIQLNALMVQAYYTLALVLQHQNKVDQAIDAMRKMIYLDRNSVLGHYGLANLYHARGQMPQAYKSLDNARHLLDARSPDEMIPQSGGITVGRLRDAISQQQQQWNAEQEYAQTHPRPLKHAQVR